MQDPFARSQSDCSAGDDWTLDLLNSLVLGTGYVADENESLLVWVLGGVTLIVGALGSVVTRLWLKLIADTAANKAEMIAAHAKREADMAAEHEKQEKAMELRMKSVEDRMAVYREELRNCHKEREIQAIKVAKLETRLELVETRLDSAATKPPSESA